MKELLGFIRINPPASQEEYSEFIVNTNDVYSLLRFLHRHDDPAELAEFRKHLQEEAHLSEEQIQDLLDGTLMWIAMDHPPEHMPYKTLDITRIMQKLINMGATANTILKGGTTLLMRTIKYPERLEMLLNLPEGKRPDLNRVNCDGDTALILAVYNNHHHSVLQLLQAGANPAIRNYFGKKASMYSTEFAMIDKLETIERGLALQNISARQNMNQDEFQRGFFQPAEKTRCSIM